jgi:catechol 2,3-dioxygenase-like lactoylglutathione lyase family enzyme
MNRSDTRLAGVELYFDDLPRAKAFYRDVLGLDLVEDAADHHAKFEVGGPFLCLEKRGVEAYPSADKAVVFFEVRDVRQTVQDVGPSHVVRYDPDAASAWAVLHDPEGHNILLIQAGPRPGASR